MDNIVIYVAASLVGFILILNSIATYVVSTTYFEVKERRIYQIVFIWLIPFLGAFFAIYLNREDHYENKKKDEIGNKTNITNSEVINHALGADHHGGR